MTQLPPHEDASDSDNRPAAVPGEFARGAQGELGGRAEPVPVRKIPATGEPAPPASRVAVMPPIDIYETDEGLVLIADLPGVSPPTLELQVQDNRLTLLGRVKQYPGEEGLLRHEEFEQADYLRSFILSEEVDHERISAKLVNGVLEVRLPRMPKSPPRRIQVTAQ
jgi:HSP20 family protein